jgi:hypothetical protein
MLNKQLGRGEVTSCANVDEKAVVCTCFTEVSGRLYMCGGDFWWRVQKVDDVL